MGLLTETLALQREAFGVDPTTLEGRALREYLQWNIEALIVEAVEAKQELAWKPWKKYEPEQIFLDDDNGFLAFCEEAIDCLHFVFNILVAMGYDDEELVESWRRKANINRERQRVQRES